MGDNNVDESGFFDTQDVAPEVSELFKAFIEPINNIRSQFSTPDQLPFDINNFAASVPKAARSGVMQSTAQESVSSAFLRSLGLPIVDPNGALYNPGYSPDDIDPNNLNSKYKIAGNISSDIYNIMKLRETFPKNRLSVYQNQNQASAEQALSLKYVKRPFSPIRDNDPEPFDTTDTQSFSLPIRNSVEQIFENPSGVDFSKIKHILKPLFVDPRIDFLVRPTPRRCGIPFLTAEERKIGSGELYKIPLLETVCRIRLSDQDDQGNVPDITALAEKIKSNADVTDKTLIDLAGSVNDFYKSQFFIGLDFIKIIKATTELLFNSLQTLQEIDQQILWIPKPSSTGPVDSVGSYDLSDVQLSQTAPNLEIDQKIQEYQYKKIIFESSINPYQSEVNGTLFSDVISQTLGASAQNIKKVFDQRLTDLLNRRKDLSNQAETALNTIATITGDDIGIGLIDMVVIFTALWTLDRKYLVDMLDDQSFQRMYRDSQGNLKCSEVVAEVQNDDPTTRKRQFDGLACMRAFQKQVQLLYSIADKFFQEKSQNG